MVSEEVPQEHRTNSEDVEYVTSLLRVQKVKHVASGLPHVLTFVPIFELARPDLAHQNLATRDTVRVFVFEV